MTDQPAVEYRDLEPLGFPGYRVGSDGSAWSRRARGPEPGLRGNRSRLGTVWRPLRMKRLPAGYLCVTLSPNPRMVLVHRLVLEAFVGSCPEGHEGCHNDGNPANNSLLNLRWDTRQANCADTARHGNRLIGERNHLAKLTADSVRAIRARHAAGGCSLKTLAAEYGTTKQAIAQVVARHTWKHVV